MRRLRDGTVQWEHRGVKLKWREVAHRVAPATAAAKSQTQVKRQATLPAERLENKPAATHPWRQQRIGSVRGAMARRAARLVVGDSPVGLRSAPASLRPHHQTQGKPTTTGDIFS